ncbi:MAG: ribose-5-phosphate isomerase RpiA [Planctomycetota bacterium]|nr:ribose-5-phosphate isomerase RpiA [Planctomycetota bacterium]
MNQANQDTLKRQAAETAVQFIQSGMVLGLGSGTTAAIALKLIGQRIQSGALNKIVGVPTSLSIAAKAQQLGIPLAPDDNPPAIDLTIDGADEVDPAWNLIKGGGGAMTREKMIAQLSTREIIVIDESKLSPQLGTRWPLPIEVLPFGWQAQARWLTEQGGAPKLRQNKDGSPYLTDQENYILDTAFGPIADANQLAALIKTRAGILEHGLFLNLTSDVIIARAGGVRHVVVR